jgi:hypothetical protein
MPVMFILLPKWTFDGKFQIHQISLLPTDSIILDHTVVLLVVYYAEAGSFGAEGSEYFWSSFANKTGKTLPASLVSLG